MRVLVCGGAGYIGSHTCVALARGRPRHRRARQFLQQLRRCGRRAAELIGRPIRLVQGDIRDRDDLAKAFQGGIDAVIHFAALKAVGESCAQPLEYFENNISGSITLLQAMQARGRPEAGVQFVRHGLWRSRHRADHRECAAAGHQSLWPHQAGGRGHDPRLLRGRSRIQRGDPALLQSGRSASQRPHRRGPGRDAHQPDALRFAQVAVGRRDRLQVFGSDYPTRDGTGVRDYIHVVDLAEAHCRALDFDPGAAAARCSTWAPGAATA